MIARALVWLVCSPIYTYVDQILDDGSGPSYDERDVLYVRCRSRARAKVLALRAWRRRFSRGRWWPGRDYLYRGENPFRGMTVERPRLT